MSSALIFDIKRYSVRDGPGIRTTVFFKGCPLSCWWCHNPESQSPEAELVLRGERCVGCGACRVACPLDLPLGGPLGAGRGDSEPAACRLCGRCVEACPAEAREMAGRRLSDDEVFRLIERDVPFYDGSGGGVTFSGGEPLAHPAAVYRLLAGCRDRGIHTAVDTSGHAPVAVLERIAPVTDLFLYDLKHMDTRAHRHHVGVGNERVLANLRRLAALEARIVVRFPVIPGVNDGPLNVQRLGAFVASLVGVRDVSLLPMHCGAAAKYDRAGRPHRFDPMRPPTTRALEAIAQCLAGFGLRATVGA